MKTIEKWGMFEAAFQGKTEGNPFLDYEIHATFKSEGEEKTVCGFYDGDGVYRVRFMPQTTGIYTYTVDGNFKGDENLSANDAEYSGSFEAVAPIGENHGPVVVRDHCRLAYADGTPYYSIGTTCYAWVNQSMELQEQTLETLKNSPFNKIRFCFFPKFYEFNYNDPLTHPFERGEGEGLDPELVEYEKEHAMHFPGMVEAENDYNFNYLRPNAEHYKRFDLRISQLQEMGIEADMILMHPYDRWGMNCMAKETCDAYLKYITARYSAYRNIWWSLANEFDFIQTKNLEDWDRYGRIVTGTDPYGHLCSAHNGGPNYDFSKPWVTHCSLQRVDFYRTTEDTDLFLKKYNKPVVWDEICYEGDIYFGWGNITGEELVRRFWEAFMRGGHCGHGETFMCPEEILWWSHGGQLKGESVPRIKFLLDIMKETPGGYMKMGKGIFDEVVGISALDETTEDFVQHYDYAIHYLGLMRPAKRKLIIPEDADYQVDLIDTWNMTITDLGIMRGYHQIDMPRKQYMAIRFRRVK